MAQEAGTEAELMRTCGHLYASIALESFATTLLAIVFSYLLLLITNKGRLSTPGHAAWQFVKQNVKCFAQELWEEVRRWRQMPDLPLEKRFAMCRKVNQAVCLFQILIAVLTIERWLHINNINGFRYLGYSMTCPPMQTELIILIAPAVPCYKLNVLTTYFVTMFMLWAGYVASVLPSGFVEGSWSTYMETMDLNDLRPTTKFWFTFAASVAQVYLSFIQIPLLFLYYKLHGGEKKGLPHAYPHLLLNVSISWLAFPVWWALSFEGMNIITDTKMNAAGFCFLNIMSKGSFTLQMLSMVQYHRNLKKREEAIAKGRRPSQEGSVGLFEEAERRSSTQPDLEPEVEKKETWVVKILRPYDSCARGTATWRSLEPTYRAYLIGRGLSSSKWDLMGIKERADVREIYEDSLADVVGLDDPEEARDGAATGLDALRVVEEGVPTQGYLGSVIDGDDKNDYDAQDSAANSTIEGPEPQPGGTRRASI